MTVQSLLDLPWRDIFSAGDFIASVIAAFALIIAVLSFRRSVEHHLYIELDQGYNAILRILIERPDLEKARTGRDYEAYANLVFNFLETIHDKSNSRALRKTWFPVLDVEAARHVDWFLANQDKFKKPFYDWMIDRLKKRNLLPNQKP